MDAVLQALGGSLPQLGVGGILTFVVGLLVKLLIDERTRHTTELDAQSKRLAGEAARDSAQYDRDLADLRADIERRAKRIEELEITVDIERAARREAEDVAARALRRRREDPRT